MRIRALTLIFLTAGWLVPAGGFACPTGDSHANGVEAHGHGPSDLADGVHEHGSDHHGDRGHHHTATPSAPGAADAPLDAPVCCSDTEESPAAIAPVPTAKPRPELIHTFLPDSALGAPGAVTLPSAASLRLRQPPPLPYARNRRPLLI